MRIRWKRVAALLFGLAVTGFIARNWAPMMTWVMAVGQVTSPYASPWERHMGLCTLALATILIVAVVKLITQSNGPGK